VFREVLCAIAWGRHMKFLEKSLTSALNFFKEAIFSEEVARKKGFLQLCNPRLKIVVFLLLILVTCLVRNIPYLIILYVFSVVLASLSGISILFFIKRVWFFIPIFTFFIAIPAVFMQSLQVAVVFVLRVTTCVSFAVLMTISTGHRELLRSLRLMGVPSIFIQVLDMTYRYVFFFVKVFEDMHMGLKSRLVKKFKGKDARRWVSSRIGYFFKRSVKMSEEVYMAMAARGYTGEFKRYDK
jgi:cobalt/nickel transport system permease protein